MKKIITLALLALSLGANAGVSYPPRVIPGPQGIQGIQGVPGTDGANGTNGTNGVKGDTGAAGKDGINALAIFSMPTARTVSLATAYQCTDISRACILTLNLNSVASLTLAGGTTITGEVRVGSSTAVATGGGVAVGMYKNSITGSLVVGVAMSTESYNTITVIVPAGGYFAIRQIAGTAGTLLVVSSFEQMIG